MASKRGSPLTIAKLMVVVCASGIVLSLFAANPNDAGMIIGLIMASLVVVIPVHFAIEGNRRDAIGARCAGQEETGQGRGA
jgi:hypothetical protein